MHRERERERETDKERERERQREGEGEGERERERGRGRGGIGKSRIQDAYGDAQEKARAGPYDRPYLKTVFWSMAKSPATGMRDRCACSSRNALVWGSLNLRVLFVRGTCAANCRRAFSSPCRMGRVSNSDADVKISRIPCVCVCVCVCVRLCVCVCARVCVCGDRERE